MSRPCGGRVVGGCPRHDASRRRPTGSGGGGAPSGSRETATGRARVRCRAGGVSARCGRSRPAGAWTAPPGRSRPSFRFRRTWQICSKQRPISCYQADLPANQWLCGKGNRIMKVGHLMQQHWPWIISGILCLAIGFVLGNSAAPVGDSEARGQLKQLEITRANDQERIAVLEIDKKSLLDKSRRLEVQLAAAEGGKGFGLEEQQQFLDDRKAELDRLQDQLVARDEIIVQRELRVATMEKEFYEKTNMTIELDPGGWTGIVT